MEHAIQSDKYRRSPSLFGSWPSRTRSGIRECSEVQLPVEPIFHEEDPQSTVLVHVVKGGSDLWQTLPNLFVMVGYQTRTYSDLGSFLKSHRPEVPGCVLLDAGVLTIGGEEMGEELRTLGTEMPFVVTAKGADVPTAVQAMKAGAIDFVELPFLEDRMLEAVATAIKADALRRSALARQAELRARFERLSRREREVMVLVTAGKMNKQVAWELGISEITVKVHRGSVMRKMGARTLADLVRMADALADVAAQAAGAMASAPGTL